MNSNNNVACPLDCFDTCQAKYENGSFKGDKDHFVTNGKLCVNFANLVNENYLTTSKYLGKEISLDESLEILVDKLKNTTPEKTLFYKGSGNLGLMQKSTGYFFSQYGSTLTKGSLCEAAGEEGIIQGRGKSINPSIENLINSDVIIVWGRNFTQTSAHMYNLVKDKTFITIDPVKTEIAKKSELHLQINPKTDYELALMLTRVAYMNGIDDEEYLEENTEGHDWFFDIAKNRPLVSYEEKCGIDLDDVYKFFDLIEDKKVSIMLGVGPQKYNEGVQITRTIDSFATFIGIHKQENAGGVWYLGTSMYGYDDLFKTKTKNKKVSLPKIDYGKFDLVFIQGANPVVSSPNTKKVIEGLKNSFVVYFGITENDTCEYADLIIPSSSFLSKKDIRLSYGHDLKSISDVVEEKNPNTITEYELTNFLCKKFDLETLKDEDEIISYYKETEVEKEEQFEEFEFIEDLDVEPLYKNKKDDNFYLITAKNPKSLNSQFAKDDYVYLNSDSNFNENDEVNISSAYGEAKFVVKINDDIKTGCAFFYAGNKFVNYLTPFEEDDEAHNAIFQEVLLDIELC